MDFNEILKILFEVPIYVWVILFFVAAYFFRDKSRWEREIEFSWVEGVGKVEVEIGHDKRKGTEIEVEMKLEERYQNKPIDILINEKTVCTVPATANNGSGRDYSIAYDFAKPHSGDRVSVVIDNEALFTGQFR